MTWIPVGNGKITPRKLVGNEKCHFPFNNIDFRKVGQDYKIYIYRDTKFEHFKIEIPSFFKFTIYRKFNDIVDDEENKYKKILGHLKSNSDEVVCLPFSKVKELSVRNTTFEESRYKNINDFFNFVADEMRRSNKRTLPNNKRVEKNNSEVKNIHVNSIIASIQRNESILNKLFEQNPQLLNKYINSSRRSTPINFSSPPPPMMSVPPPPPPPMMGMLPPPPPPPPGFGAPPPPPPLPPMMTMPKPGKMKIREHPNYQKYVRMSKVGVPIPSIKQKIAMEAPQLNPDYLNNLNQEINAPQSQSMNSPQAALFAAIRSGTTLRKTRSNTNNNNAVAQNEANPQAALFAAIRSGPQLRKTKRNNNSTPASAPSSTGFLDELRTRQQERKNKPVMSINNALAESRSNQVPETFRSQESLLRKVQRPKTLSQRIKNADNKNQLMELIEEYKSNKPNSATLRNIVSKVESLANWNNDIKGNVYNTLKNTVSTPNEKFTLRRLQIL